MAANRQGKMIDHRMRITLIDGRQMVGQMLAFDKHMNLVLADTEEFRKVKRKPNKGAAPGAAAGPLVESEEKRTLGLTIVRGTNIVSLSVESGPPSDPAARLGAQSSNTGGAPAAMSAGTGAARSVGRGLAVGLQGPAPGVGAGGFGGFPNAQQGPPGFGRGGPFPPGAPPNFQGFPPGGPPGGPPPGFSGPPGGRGFPPPPGGGYQGR
ncbi:MAG: hypothetical protein Q9159_004414 [Coniocarpon cinnabarinum]